jgi:hypothetical protein
MRLHVLVLGLLAGLMPAEDLAGRYPLSFHELPDVPPATSWIEAQNGTAEMPFPTADRKLRLAKRGETWLVDRNGDSKLDDQDLPTIKGGDSFTVPITLGGKVYQTKLSLLTIDNEDRYLAVSGSLALSATVGTNRISLIDGNLDGFFGVVDKDQVAVSAVDSKTPPIPNTQGRLIAINGKLYDLAIVDQGAALELKPWNSPVATLTLALAAPTGRDAAKPTEANVTLRHQNGLMWVTLSDTLPVTLAAGSYEIFDETFVVTLPAAAGDKPRTLHFAGETPAPLVTIAAGENTLRRGLPDRLITESIMSKPDTVLVYSATLADAHGGRWRAELDKDVKSTLACLIKADGKEQQLCTMEYG